MPTVIANPTDASPSPVFACKLTVWATREMSCVGNATEKDDRAMEAPAAISTDFILCTVKRYSNITNMLLNGRKSTKET